MVFAGARERHLPDPRIGLFEILGRDGTSPSAFYGATRPSSFMSRDQYGPSSVMSRDQYGPSSVMSRDKNNSHSGGGFGGLPQGAKITGQRSH